MEITRTLNVDQVQKKYSQIEREKGVIPRQDVLQLIGNYPVWEQKVWPITSMGRLKIFYDRTPWSAILTQEGRHLTVDHAAHNLLLHSSNLQAEAPWVYQYMQGIFQALDEEPTLEPPLIIPGSKYQAPISDFLDGTKCSIASFAYYLSTGKEFSMEVLIGSKLPFWQRALRKVETIRPSTIKKVFASF